MPKDSLDLSDSETFFKKFDEDLKKLGISDSQIETVSQPTDEYVVVFRPFEKKSKPKLSVNTKKGRVVCTTTKENSGKRAWGIMGVIKKKMEKMLLLPLNPAYGINLSAQEALKRVKQFFKIGKK